MNAAAWITVTIGLGIPGLFILGVLSADWIKEKPLPPRLYDYAAAMAALGATFTLGFLIAILSGQAA